MKKVLVSFMCLLTACGEGVVAPTPSPVTTTTATQSGCGNIQGNGNTVNCNTATPTPAPSSNLPQCFRGVPVYEHNVTLAQFGLPAGQTPAAFLVALSLSLKNIGFQVTTGGALPPDEIAIKIVGFSETYDVCKGVLTTCEPQVLYMETCNPARF